MYSDEWLKLGYSSGEQIQVSDYVFYRIWHDDAGVDIGAGVDFETDNDFPYEMPISEWQRFLKNVLRVSHSDDVTATFREYFTKNVGLFDFERDLSINGIGFQKFFF